MKNYLWLVLLTIPLLLLSCNEDEEEITHDQQMVTKEAPIRWAPWPCTVNDELGIPVAAGVKCKYHQDGGCKWPTKCKKISYAFVQFAIDNTPGLSEDNWTNEAFP